jgi:hypothetical protein
MITLSKEKGWIFRITHIDNVPWILANGLHCRNSGTCDPAYHDIGNPDLIEKRHHRQIPVAPAGTLSDYIPFYFTPYSPMLLNIKTGYNGMKQTPMPEIVILVACIHDLARQGVQFVIADRHAYLATATFAGDLSGLEQLNWTILQNRDFKRDPNDPSKFERYQAEALIFRHLPVTALASILCYGTQQEAQLKGFVARASLATPILVRPYCYF